MHLLIYLLSLSLHLSPHKEKRVTQLVLYFCEQEIAMQFFLLQLAKTQIFIGGVTTKNLNNDTKFQASFYSLVLAAATTVMQRTITFIITKLVSNSF